MQYQKLGSSDINVSEVCLGTMTFGEQTDLSDAHQQMDYAFNQGVNFFDTAEMYAVPPKPQTQGATEEIMGKWFANNSEKREKIIVATKIAGPGVSWIREGAPISAESIFMAVEQSLARLQLDYIDLYQLHWPNRTSPHFSKHWPGMVDHSQVDTEKARSEKREILQALDECIKAGKIRYVGLSNETPWGIKEYLQIARQYNLPEVISTQHEFSLLHLKDIPYVLETCVLDNVAYLPWSPLAGGALTGKYRHGQRPENCRWSMSQRNGLFRDTTRTESAIDAFYEVAAKHRMTLTALSLAWVYQYPGVASTIIGASNITQLHENLAAYDIELTKEILKDIDAVIRQFPLPF